MGLRFRRTIRIAPGIRLNLSKSGVSTSIGRRGAHVTIGHGKVRETVGLPGSGLSYTHVDNMHHAGQGEATSQSGGRLLHWLVGILLTLIGLLVLAAVAGMLLAR